MINTSVAKDVTERAKRSEGESSGRHNPMSESSRRANREWFPGLCSSCVNDASCTFPRLVDRPVRSCDEFVGVEAPPHSVARAQPISERFAMANREWLPGLCKSCEKRQSCTFPKPEGGVFHCEEFE